MAMTPFKGVSDAISLMIYRSEAELFKMNDAERQKMTSEYGAFTQSIIQSGHFKAGDGLQP